MTGIIIPFIPQRKIAGKPVRTAKKAVNNNNIKGMPATNAGRLNPL